MKSLADTPAAALGRELAQRQGKLPPAALALARLIGEAIGEHAWLQTLAEVEGKAGAEDALQASKPEPIAEPSSPGAAGAAWAARGGQIHPTGAARLTKGGLD